MDFSGGSLVKNPPANAEYVGSISRIKEDPLEKEMAIYSNILAWEIPWSKGAWWGVSHGVEKSQSQT